MAQLRTCFTCKKPGHIAKNCHSTTQTMEFRPLAKSTTTLYQWQIKHDRPICKCTVWEHNTDCPRKSMASRLAASLSPSEKAEVDEKHAKKLEAEKKAKHDAFLVREQRRNERQARKAAQEAERLRKGIESLKTLHGRFWYRYAEGTEFDCPEAWNLRDAEEEREMHEYHEEQKWEDEFHKKNAEMNAFAQTVTPENVTVKLRNNFPFDLHEFLRFHSEILHWLCRADPNFDRASFDEFIRDEEDAFDTMGMEWGDAFQREQTLERQREVKYKEGVRNGTLLKLA